MNLEKRLGRVLLEDHFDIRNLNKYDIPFVVIGARAINAYIKRPRNTQDIDILTNDAEKLTQAILKDNPNFTCKSNEAEYRIYNGNQEIIDILVPYHEIFKKAMDDTRIVDNLSIPSIEALIALKFAAIMGKHRPIERKLQDRVDIGMMYFHNKADINFNKVYDYISVLYFDAVSDFKVFMTKLKTDLGE